MKRPFNLTSKGVVLPGARAIASGIWTLTTCLYLCAHNTLYLRLVYCGRLIPTFSIIMAACWVHKNGTQVCKKNLVQGLADCWTEDASLMHTLGETFACKEKQDGMVLGPCFHFPPFSETRCRVLFLRGVAPLPFLCSNTMLSFAGQWRCKRPFPHLHVCVLQAFAYARQIKGLVSRECEHPGCGAGQICPYNKLLTHCDQSFNLPCICKCLQSLLPNSRRSREACCLNSQALLPGIATDLSKA